MKQVISIADFATILNELNHRIKEMELPIFNYLVGDKVGEKEVKKHKEKLKENPYYQSLLHAKKVLEECKVEIEVPDLEVEA